MAAPDDEILGLYHQTIRPLYAFVSRRVGGDRALAEDLVQDVWLRALTTWPVRGIPTEPQAWLIEVARNALISHFRRMRPDLVDPGVLDLDASPQPAADGDSAAVIAWGMARMRRRHADLLEAFYFEERSLRDIARERGLSERAVEGRLRRARARLRKILDRLKRPSARSAAERRIEHA